MIRVNLQLFGGRGGGSGMSGGSVSQAQVNSAASDFIKHNMTTGTQSVSLDKATIVGDVDDDGYANVKVDYTASVRVATGYDSETGQMTYENDTEYRSDTFKIKVGEGGGNKSPATKTAAKDAAESTSQYSLKYTETTSGGSWNVSGKPKGSKSSVGNAGAELTPNSKGGFTVTTWGKDGGVAGKKDYTSLKPAVKATKNYLQSGYKKT